MGLQVAIPAFLNLMVPWALRIHRANVVRIEVPLLSRPSSSAFASAYALSPSANEFSVWGVFPAFWLIVPPFANAPSVQTLCRIVSVCAAAVQSFYPLFLYSVV